MTPPLPLPAVTRADFSIPDGVHYLNCAYMSPLHRRVEAAGMEGMARKRAPWTVGASDFFAEADEVRALFARLIGAPDPARIALLPSASYGLSAAARNARIGRGERVVLTEGQFPSNVYPWQRAAAEAGGTVHFVPPGEGPRRGARWNERILDAIRPGTAVVSLGPVHWTDGTRFDLVRIGERAREVGARLVIDGSQAIGALPFLLEEVRPDALVAVGYKWLMGPYSTTLGYFGPFFDAGTPLEESWLARVGSDDFRGLVDYEERYLPGAARYDMGERSNFILLPMLAEALRLLLEWTPEHIAAHAAALNRLLAEGVEGLGMSVEEEDWRGAHILGVRMPAGAELMQVQRELGRRGIHASLRGSALRVSPHLYNDSNDVAALLEALGAAVPG
jgi:selenocysteine lyase/cysteine desulfurase